MSYVLKTAENSNDIKLSQLYLFEENNKLECEFCSCKIKIHFPSYMLPLPRKI